MSLRVLHIVPSFHPARAYGGPVTSVLALCKALREAGVDVRVLTTDTNGLRRNLDGRTDAEIDVEGVPVRYCRKVVGHSVSPGLLRRIPQRVEEADLVHLTAVYNFPTLPTMLACRSFGRPLVWSPRGALQRWPGARRTLAKAAAEAVLRLVLPRETVLHVTSDAEREATRARFPETEVAVVPNGVAVPPTPPKKPRVRGRHLLFLGRLDPKKGVENLLRAVALLRDGGRDGWRLTVAGSGRPDYEAGLRRLARDLDVADAVSFVGAVHGRAKEEAFSEADLMVVPSHVENFGMVVAEGLAHGLPVVASRGTPWSALERYGCGLWVDNDPVSLQNAVRRMAKMPLAEMGARGRRWMEEEFSWETVGQRMLEVYRTLLEGRAKRADTGG